VLPVPSSPSVVAPVTLTPAWIVARLDERIVGQQAAKQKLAGALWWNRYRRALLAKGVDARSLPERQNVLLAGPTGTGKTLLARAAAELLGVPFLATSAPSYSAAGYTGLNPEDMITALVQVAGGDPARAETGIIFIDEVDKIRQRDLGGHDDVGGKSVQQALLAFLDDTSALIKKSGDEKIAVPTGGITFIAAGAFVGLEEVRERRHDGDNDHEEAGHRHLSSEDLIEYGLIPEFVARFPVRVGLLPLTRRQLDQLLRQSSLARYTELFRLHGIDLCVDDAAIDVLLELALLEGTGARALHEIVSDRLLHVFNSLPDLLAEGINRVIIDAETVRCRRAPWKIAGEPICPPIEVSLPVEPAGELAKPGISITHDWSETRLRERLQVVREKLDWANTTGSARKWWEAFEQENRTRLGLVVRLTEELLLRKATITEFFLAYVYSNTDNIQANLHYLDYTRLKKEEERKKRQAVQGAQPACSGLPRFRTGEVCPANAAGRYEFAGYLDEALRPVPFRDDPVVTLAAGETFPPIGPDGMPCWWKKVKGA
jgi:ATP-dependent Clp protease ATP-binding subunit ClpX